MKRGAKTLNAIKKSWVVLIVPLWLIGLFLGLIIVPVSFVAAYIEYDFINPDLSLDSTWSFNVMGRYLDYVLPRREY